ncbi:MAG: ATP-dependent zinc metalloprotease FtsH [Candidatus Hinthialibacter sp.]
MDKNTRFNIIYVFLALWGVLILHDVIVSASQVSNIPYSQFEQLLSEGKVKEVSISSTRIRGTLSAPLENGNTKFVTVRVDTDLAKKLSEAGITYSQIVENTFFTTLLSWIVPIFIFMGLWWFLMTRLSKGGLGGQLMSVGKSKAKIYVETDTKIRFDDVAGVDEAKEELQEIVNFLKNPEEYGKLGAKMPKGVLLVGPPGTGKTLLAKAAAGEAGVPFFSISGSEFVEMFVGVGAARVRDLFEQARGKSPCIIFIDELDALGKARSSGMIGGGHDEKEQTLNQLLVELDGFDSRTGIVLLGATNRPEILDPALLRAGRFDRQVLVDRPDKLGRLAILKVHIQKIKVSPDLDLEQIAALTPGFTGADLENLVNEAALIATRDRKDYVNLDHFTHAIERIVAGLEKKNRILNPQERKIVAYHEMGHALVAAGLPSTDPVHKVSIIPRGIGALGYTLQRPTEDRYLMTYDELMDKMTVLLGGRAAERLIFEHLSTGAANDLQRASETARAMVTQYGMDEELGHAAYDSEPSGFLGQNAIPPSRKYSDETARQIDIAVRNLVNQAMDRALDMLKTNIDLLHRSTKRLMESETLTEEELKEFFKEIIPASSSSSAASQDAVE